ncbi:hypothetical protein [Planctobacterium marinum]|uniref:hypothetical protein n=1 Tax=Planctobacterium marinum TaxID=1631968 RepID=UPI001E2ACF49|nr:hypothetical protein [Planctobacterium marinum]MCC2607988.1 hypothetical protein [Planctobacterium marinum]
MNELTFEEIDEVNGAGIIDDVASSLGYAVGSAAGYFYRNVMISDRWIDDLAML